MKIKLRYRLYLTASMILLICSAPIVVDAQMFDGNREGLFFGGGVGYAGVVSGDYGSATGFTTSGKIGFGVSDQLQIYISSDVLSFFPRVGLAYFLDPPSQLFVQGAVGYTSADDDSILSISGGAGYELSSHLTLEFLLGYNSLSETQYSSFGFYGSSTETVKSNYITIAATFNYYFY